MPGTPTPVLGSESATWAAAAVLVALTYGGPLLAGRLSGAHDTTGDVVAAAVAVSHVLLAIAVWAGARHATGRFLPPSALVWALLVATVAVLALQAAIPVVGYRRSGAVLPLAVGIGASTLVYGSLLRVGGESDPLVLYGVTLGWVVLVAILAVGVLEARLRRYVASGA